MGSWKLRIRWVTIVLGVIALACGYKGRSDLRDDLGLVEGRLDHDAVPNVSWERATPAEEGLDSARLDRLRDDLADWNSAEVLVVRGGRLVYEWYSSVHGPNFLQSNAAMAKGAVGDMILLTELTDGRVRLEDPVSRFVPAWKSDSLRSQITVGELASHRSGLADVDFFRGEDGELQGWQKAYYKDPAGRFRMALHDVPMIFRPGTRWQYSGIGYYALAYTLTAALRGAPWTDALSLYRARVMRPLGIPDHAWELSYGESYRYDGLHLYAIGSGADFTPRAEARLGELMLEGGAWRGRRLFRRACVEKLLTPATVPPYDSANATGHPLPAGGWWMNADGAWPSLPRDAFAAIGGTEQILLVVPSLDLVVVRMGGSMLEPGEGLQEALNARLFEPLAASVIGPSRRMREGVAPFLHLVGDSAVEHLSSAHACGMGNGREPAPTAHS